MIRHPKIYLKENLEFHVLFKNRIESGWTLDTLPSNDLFPPSFAFYTEKASIFILKKDL